MATMVSTLLETFVSLPSFVFRFPMDGFTGAKERSSQKISGWVPRNWQQDSVYRVPFTRLAGEDTQKFLSLALAKIKESAGLTLDMSQVETMDSRGIAALLKCWQQARRQGKEIRLQGVKPALRIILKVVQLDRLFSLESPNTTVSERVGLAAIA